jgi:hypothetical protein
MKRSVLKSRGIVMLVAVGLFAWGVGHPEPAWSGDSCSLRSLKGTYVGACHGVQGSTQAHFAAACNDHFHGDGTVSGVCSSTDKDNASRNVSYTATYTVNPDCTGTFTSTDGATHLDLFVARDGSLFGATFTDPGVVDAFVEQRVSQQD